MWTWSAGPCNVGPRFDLSQATSRTVTWTRSTGCSASFDLAGKQRAFGLMIPLQTDVWLQRDGKVWFRGRHSNRSGGGTSTKTSRTHQVAGYKAVLHHRPVEGAHIAWTATDPADAGWQLIVDEQARTGSDLGIVRGPRRPSAAIASFNVQADQALDEAQDALTKFVAGGGDWDITPTSLMDLQYDFWPITRGTDRSQKIDVGGRAVSFTDQVTTDSYANAVKLTGQAPSGGGAAPAAVSRDAADIATRIEGRFENVISTEQTTEAALIQRAPQELALAEQVPITWTCELARGWWNPDRLWIGDPFTWVCKAPGYDVIETQVVEQITAAFDIAPLPSPDLTTDQLEQIAGEPKVTLTFGAPAPTARFRRRQINQTLAALARR